MFDNAMIVQLGDHADNARDATSASSSSPRLYQIQGDSDAYTRGNACRFQPQTLLIINIIDWPNAAFEVVARPSALLADTVCLLTQPADNSFVNLVALSFRFVYRSFGSCSVDLVERAQCRRVEGRTCSQVRARLCSSSKSQTFDRVYFAV